MPGASAQRSLLRVARAYEAFDRSEAPLIADDLTAAAAPIEEAHELAPDDDQITLWAALTIGAAGRIDEAHRLFAEASRIEPRGAEHLRRFLDAGHLPAAVGPVIASLSDESRNGRSPRG